MTTPLTQAYYCLSKNGGFDSDPNNDRGTTLDQLKSAISSATASAKPIAIFVHGGLVDQARGLATAGDLIDPYLQAPGYPFFEIWRSGIVDALGDQIASLEDTVSSSLSWILGNDRVQKLINAASAQNTPENHALAVQDLPATGMRNMKFTFAAAADPFTGDDPPPALAEKLHRAFAVDSNVVYLDKLAKTEPKTQVLRARFGAVPAATISDNEVADRVREATARHESHVMALGLPLAPGLPNPISLVGVMIKVTWNIIKRYLSGRSHPGMCTVTEEVLRALFIGDVGTDIWSQMKDECVKAFIDDGAGVGKALIDIFTTMMQDPDADFPRVVLIGHSAGAIWIAEMLKAIDRRGLPEKVKFDVVLIAAAATLASYQPILSEPVVKRVREFRSFGMDDARESNDELVVIPGMPKGQGLNALLRAFYQASLLYFISGILEGATIDAPLVGMQRFRNSQFSAEVGFAELTAFEQAHTPVWSPTIDGLAGRNSDGDTHGGFPSEAATLQSTQALINHWQG